MHRVLLIAFSCVALLATSVSVNADDKDDKKKKYTIKVVMKKAMKGGLCKKVASGKADPKEVDTLLAMFESMAKQKVKKGDAKSWKEKNEALIKAVKGVKEKKKDAGPALIKAANCKNCHSKHKG